MLGFATGFALFAQRARLAFRDGSLGFCCAFPEDFCTVGFAVFPAEDLFCCFILSHFGTGVVDTNDVTCEVDNGVAHIISSFRCLV